MVNDTDTKARCLICEYSKDEADDSVVFKSVEDDGYICTGCLSLLRGWKQNSACLVLVNDDFPDEDIQEFKSTLSEMLDDVELSMDDLGKGNAMSP